MFIFLYVALRAASILKNMFFYIYLISSRWQNTFMWWGLSFRSMLELLVLKNDAQCTSQRFKWRSGARVVIIFGRSVVRSLGRSLARSLDRSIARSIGRSLDRSLDRSIARSLDRSVARSVARSLDRSIARSIGRSLDRSLDRSIGFTIAIVYAITAGLEFMSRLNCLTLGLRKYFHVQVTV